jgi:hypothetical protein
MINKTPPTKHPHATRMSFVVSGSSLLDGDDAVYIVGTLVRIVGLSVGTGVGEIPDMTGGPTWTTGDVAWYNEGACCTLAIVFRLLVKLADTATASWSCVAPAAMINVAATWEVELANDFETVNDTITPGRGPCCNCMCRCAVIEGDDGSGTTDWIAISPTPIARDWLIDIVCATRSLKHGVALESFLNSPNETPCNVCTKEIDTTKEPAIVGVDVGAGVKVGVGVGRTVFALVGLRVATKVGKPVGAAVTIDGSGVGLPKANEGDSDGTTEGVAVGAALGSIVGKPGRYVGSSEGFLDGEKVGANDGLGVGLDNA